MCFVGGSKGGEFAGQQQLAIGLSSHTAYGAVGIGVERRIDRSVAVEPGEMIAHVLPDLHKGAADHDTAVGLDHDAGHGVADARIDKAGVDTSIDEQPGQMVALRLAVDHGEVAANQNLAVGLHGRAEHVVVDGHVEAVVGALRVNPCCVEEQDD